VVNFILLPYLYFVILLLFFFALKIVGSPQVTLTWPALSVTIYLHSALCCYLMDQKTRYAGSPIIDQEHPRSIYLLLNMFSIKCTVKC
jgi:hypothetical protein